jgi:hypothetical protein
MELNVYETRCESFPAIIQTKNDRVELEELIHFSFEICFLTSPLVLSAI